MSDCELFKTRAMEKIGQLKKQIAELEAQIPCWIPVGERLPEPRLVNGRGGNTSESVIAEYIQDGAYTVIGQANYIRRKKQGGGYWQAGLGNINIKVLRWTKMPLPSAPGEPHE